MSTILFAWEGGANLGHVDRMIGIARLLRERGYEPVFALRDVTRSYTRLVREGFRVLQAPVWVPRPGAAAPQMVNFASILASVGWLEAEHLAGLVSAWRELFAQLSPALLIADHSPTALLAWRSSGKPAATLGSSFELPPPGPGFPPFRWWESRHQALATQIDAAVLSIANDALAMLDEAPLAKLPDIFAVRAHFLLGLPELSHYGEYPAHIPFVGPSFRADAGVTPSWPLAEGPRVFAYLDAAHKDFALLMEALRKLEWPTLVYAPGIDDALLRRLQSHTLAFSTSPLRMDSVLADAQLVISHASLGTASAALLAGKPQLVLPNHVEQYMVARCVETLGAGLMSVPGERRMDYRAALRRLVTEPGFREAAEKVAKRHAGATPARTDEHVAEACLALLD
ncbi:MAG: glycosyltransferase [Rhodocyclaceae bacterium]